MGKSLTDVDARIERVERRLRLLSGGLLLVPLPPVVLALTVPIASLQPLGGSGPGKLGRSLSPWALIGEFGDLTSAFGVRPAVVVLVVGLLALAVGCCAVAARAADGTARDDAWAARWLLVVRVASVAVVLAAFPLPLLLDSADHVAYTGSGPPFAAESTGWSLAVLSGVLAWSLATLVHRADEVW